MAGVQGTGWGWEGGGHVVEIEYLLNRLSPLLWEPRDYMATSDCGIGPYLGLLLPATPNSNVQSPL